PPAYVAQHWFNMASPPQDGAFLEEAEHVNDPGDYLRNFPQRARTPPAELKGTRVVSIPPAATLPAHGVLTLLDRAPGPARWLEDRFAPADISVPEGRRMIA